MAFLTRIVQNYQVKAVPNCDVGSRLMSQALRLVKAVERSSQQRPKSSGKKPYVI